MACLVVFPTAILIMTPLVIAQLVANTVRPLTGLCPPRYRKDVGYLPFSPYVNPDICVGAGHIVQGVERLHSASAVVVVDSAARASVAVVDRDARAQSGTCAPLPPADIKGLNVRPGMSTVKRHDGSQPGSAAEKGRGHRGPYCPPLPALIGAPNN